MHNPVVKVKKILAINKPGHTRSVHMQYGIENEDMAVQKFVQQMIHSGHSCSVNECGLFVEEGSGVLAATPDRLVSFCKQRTYPIGCSYRQAEAE